MHCKVLSKYILIHNLHMIEHFKICFTCYLLITEPIFLLIFNGWLLTNVCNIIMRQNWCKITRKNYEITCNLDKVQILSTTRIWSSNNAYLTFSWSHGNIFCSKIKLLTFFFITWNLIISKVKIQKIFQMNHKNVNNN